LFEATRHAHLWSLPSHRKYHQTERQVRQANATTSLALHIRRAAGGPFDIHPTHPPAIAGLEANLPERRFGTSRIETRLALAGGLSEWRESLD
jgi:hypothetical protein